MIYWAFRKLSVSIGLNSIPNFRLQNSRTKNKRMNKSKCSLRWKRTRSDSHLPQLAKKARYTKFIIKKASSWPWITRRMQSEWCREENRKEVGRCAIVFFSATALNTARQITFLMHWGSDEWTASKCQVHATIARCIETRPTAANASGISSNAD